LQEANEYKNKRIFDIIAKNEGAVTASMHSNKTSS